MRYGSNLKYVSDALPQLSQPVAAENGVLGMPQFYIAGPFKHPCLCPVTMSHPNRRLDICS